MRKKTALRTPQRETSLRKQGGLIVRGKNSQESATAKSTLTNRSHRTCFRASACVSTRSTPAPLSPRSRGRSRPAPAGRRSYSDDRRRGGDEQRGRDGIARDAERPG